MTMSLTVYDMLYNEQNVLCRTVATWDMCKIGQQLRMLHTQELAYFDCAIFKSAKMTDYLKHHITIKAADHKKWCIERKFSKDPWRTKTVWYIEGKLYENC